MPSVTHLTKDLTMKSKLLLAAGVLALSACATPGDDAKSASASASASAKPTDGEFTLSYEKFKLDNGLEVILHKDSSDPIVAFTTVFHVGSNREKAGRTGFAHFFEHMAFNDSENVPRGWNRKAIPDWGGQRNGGTWSDGTIYFEVVPKDAVDKILWIDSDRLGYMINTVTQEALDAEKQVVKNEKRQRVDNAPYGYTQEVIRKALYPDGHPYSWTVIGALPDLQAATLGDLREFYDAYYGAANATLAIAGDIDIAEMKEKVERWFGEIRQGPPVEKPSPMPVALEADKSLFFEDNFAKLPELRLTFPTVEANHPDEQALRVLGALLAGSKSAPLYREIVETQKLAPGVSGFNNSMELAGEFVFAVRANPGVDLDAVNAAIATALSTFEAEGVNETDLQRIKAEQETGLFGSYSTVLGKSNQLASDNEFTGDPLYSVSQVDALDALTADNIVAVYEKYIKDRPAIFTSFVPAGERDLALEGAERATVWIEEVKADVASENVTRGEVGDYEKTPSTYDRSEPPFGELPLLKSPEIWSASYDNGVEIYGIENDETPLVEFTIVLDGGESLDPIAQSGRMGLLASIMNEGTASRTAAEFEQAVGLLGSTLSVDVGAEELVISGSSLARNLPATLALAEELIREPRLTDDAFAKVKQAALTAIKGSEANPNAIAARVFNNRIYGDEHPLGQTLDAAAIAVERLTLDDLRDAHTALAGVDVAIHIAGDVSAPRARDSFKGVAAAFDPGETKPLVFDIPPQDDAGNVFFIDVPGSKQSVLTIGRLAVNATDPDFYRLDFTNEKLGGGISGDFAQVLRIEKGYTYGAGSGIGESLAPRPWLARTSVRANATQASLEIMRDMIGDYGPNFGEADAELTKNKIVKSDTRAFESLNAKVNVLEAISKYDRAVDFVEQRQATLLDMGVDDFKATAGKYFQPDEMIYVIVGDKETQFEPVSAFAETLPGGSLIELDIYGKRVR